MKFDPNPIIKLRVQIALFESRFRISCLPNFSEFYPAPFVDAVCKLNRQAMDMLSRHLVVIID